MSPSFFGCIRLDVYLETRSSQALVTTLWPTREATETASQSTRWKELRARLDETMDGEPSVRIMYRAFSG
jgi:quinol monooxygenase YgiN